MSLARHSYVNRCSSTGNFSGVSGRDISDKAELISLVSLPTLL